MTETSMKSEVVFQQVFDAMRQDPGVILFTVLQWIPERSSLRRLFTSHPAEYPVGGEKTVEISPGWLGTVIEGKKPFMAPDLAALREVFADSELIEQLGCGAVINVPVLDGGGNVAGVLALLDAEGSYTQQSVEAAVDVVKTNLADIIHAFAAHPHDVPGKDAPK
ncbi:GAF domain-containing protein [Pseudarthrobacter sp. BRE9]|jgi:GAF domain|uniref:GAF domain-containing protein n=1 Tax=Pseudarthrobacter sp. BRE9 TaxID=2962582 RepID=UPI002882A875|nr:GAF domain-containing protein [Pseudarthrobacter sp. BRE9]MDT0168483.1 GAF domain-containing protein [Pseudarthrobacter sp. BRE9]